MKKCIIILFAIVIVLGSSFILENRLLILSTEITNGEHVGSYRDEVTDGVSHYEERILEFPPEKVLRELDKYDCSNNDISANDVINWCGIREYQYKNEIIKIKQETVVIEETSGGSKRLGDKYYYYDEEEYKYLEEYLEELKGIYVIR